MQQIADILAQWPSLAELAADLNVPYDTAKSWRRRGRVPASRWSLLIEKGRTRGIVISVNDLMKAA